MNIGIIDFGVGNINSIFSMYRYLGIVSKVVESSNEIEDLDKIILPGVGSFDYGMKSIHERGLFEILNYKALVQKVPILGICLGMQIITNGSDEGNQNGFSWIDGFSKKFNLKEDNLKVPHMGWNDFIIKNDHPLMKEVDHKGRFYFSHSYHVTCHEKIIVAQTNYGYNFPSIIAKDNIIGVQFHPEKSHKFGMQILHNFALKL